MTPEPSLAAAFRYTVNKADSAAALGSGEVPVLAIPRVLALAERATVAAVAGTLEVGATTVGVRVELDHLAPRPVGPIWRSPRCWSGLPAGGCSSPSASTMATGWRLAA